MAEEEQDDRNELRDFLISRGHSAEKVNRALESYKKKESPKMSALGRLGESAYRGFVGGRPLEGEGLVEKTVRTVADVGPSAITGALGTLGGTALTGPGGPVMGGMTASGTRMAQKAVGAGLEEFRKAKDPSYKGVVDKETPLQAGIDVAGTGLGEFAGAKYAKGFEIRATQAKDFIKNTTIAASSKLTNKTPGTIKSFIENYSEALKLNSEDYRKMYREAITPEGADSPLLSGFEYASKKIGKTGEAEVHSELRNIADSTVTKLENPDFFKPRSNELVKELDVLGNKIAKAETQAKNIKLKHQGIEVERTRLEQRINKNELERLSLERQIGKLRKINSPEAQEKAKLLGEKIDLKAKEAGDLNKEIQLKEDRLSSVSDELEVRNAELDGLITKKAEFADKSASEISELSRKPTLQEMLAALQKNNFDVYRTADTAGRRRIQETSKLLMDNLEKSGVNIREAERVYHLGKIGGGMEELFPSTRDTAPIMEAIRAGVPAFFAYSHPAMAAAMLASQSPKAWSLMIGLAKAVEPIVATSGKVSTPFIRQEVGRKVGSKLGAFGGKKDERSNP